MADLSLLQKQNTMTNLKIPIWYSEAIIPRITSNSMACSSCSIHSHQFDTYVLISCSHLLISSLMYIVCEQNYFSVNKNCCCTFCNNHVGGINQLGYVLHEFVLI